MNRGAQTLYGLGIIMTVVIAVYVWHGAQAAQQRTCRNAAATALFLDSDIKLRRKQAAQSRAYAGRWRQLAQHTATVAVHNFILDEADRLDSDARTSLVVVRRWDQYLRQLATCKQ